jgi:hypothetical protein
MRIILKQMVYLYVWLLRHTLASYIQFLYSTHYSSGKDADRVSSSDVNVQVWCLFCSQTIYDVISYDMIYLLLW